MLVQIEIGDDLARRHSCAVFEPDVVESELFPAPAFNKMKQERQPLRHAATCAAGATCLSEVEPLKKNKARTHTQHTNMNQTHTHTHTYTHIHTNT